MNKYISMEFDDIDGNRGMVMSYYDITDEDIEPIKKQIVEYIEATGELPQKEFAVYLIDDENGEY